MIEAISPNWRLGALIELDPVSRLLPASNSIRRSLACAYIRQMCRATHVYVFHFEKAMRMLDVALSATMARPINSSVVYLTISTATSSTSVGRIKDLPDVVPDVRTARGVLYLQYVKVGAGSDTSWTR